MFKSANLVQRGREERMEGWWEEKREGEGRTEGVKEGARVRVCVQARERESK